MTKERDEDAPPEETLTERALEETAQKKKEQARAGKEGQKRQFEFAERKKILMTFENKNYNRIYFTEGRGNTSKKWITMYDHSALFFLKKIAPLIESKAQLRPDEDYESQSKFADIVVGGGGSEDDAGDFGGAGEDRRMSIRSN